ncbi:MAG: class I SAM-dependent methyltransferase [Gammaproteobacteria bacterium]|nr:class I SAM-dependent methyltransferase [Gammaproteobacteria bacterium]
MSTQEKKTFFATYDWAKSWQDLPWAHEEPTLFLAEITRQRPPGRALDIGCGAGTDSVFLASRGWRVTALDFMPKALEYTTERARKAGVGVDVVEADITEWQVPGAFDLVLDHGLLHNMDPVRHGAYRERLLAALARDGDFLLLHWHPRFPGQANGRMGPRRVDRDDIKAFFAPELQERFFAREEFEDLPDLVGGGMTQAYYWFRRNLARLEPAALLEQIRSTLARHGVDATAALAAAGAIPIEPGLPAGLLERILGPGRLGIVHRPMGPGEGDAELTAWAGHAGVTPGEVRKLLTLFAGEEHGKICVAAAPRCEQCEVRFCKRLRYR